MFDLKKWIEAILDSEDKNTQKNLSSHFIYTRNAIKTIVHLLWRSKKRNPLIDNLTIDTTPCNRNKILQTYILNSSNSKLSSYIQLAHHPKHKPWLEFIHYILKMTIIKLIRKLLLTLALKWSPLLWNETCWPKLNLRIPYLNHFFLWIWKCQNVTLF